MGNFGDNSRRSKFGKKEAANIIYSSNVLESMDPEVTGDRHEHGHLNTHRVFSRGQNPVEKLLDVLPEQKHSNFV